MEDDSRTKPITVRALPEQIEEWEEEAEELDYNNRSWYIISQVEAGRRQLAELRPTAEEGGEDLEGQILDAVPEDEPRAPDEIVEEIIGPIKQQTYEMLEELNERGQISFRAQEMGYIKNE